MDNGRLTVDAVGRPLLGRMAGVASDQRRCVSRLAVEPEPPPAFAERPGEDTVEDQGLFMARMPQAARRTRRSAA